MLELNPARVEGAQSKSPCVEPASGSTVTSYSGLLQIIEIRKPQRVLVNLVAAGICIAFPTCTGTDRPYVMFRLAGESISSTDGVLQIVGLDLSGRKSCHTKEA